MNGKLRRERNKWSSNMWNTGLHVHEPQAVHEPHQPVLSWMLPLVESSPPVWTVTVNHVHLSALTYSVHYCDVIMYEACSAATMSTHDLAMSTHMSVQAKLTTACAVYTIFWGGDKGGER